MLEYIWLNLNKYISLQVEDRYYSYADETDGNRCKIGFNTGFGNIPEKYHKLISFHIDYNIFIWKFKKNTSSNVYDFSKSLSKIINCDKYKNIPINSNEKLNDYYPKELCEFAFINTDYTHRWIKAINRINFKGYNIDEYTFIDDIRRCEYIASNNRKEFGSFYIYDDEFNIKPLTYRENRQEYTEYINFILSNKDHIEKQFRQEENDIRDMLINCISNNESISNLVWFEYPNEEKNYYTDIKNIFLLETDSYFIVFNFNYFE